MLARTRGAVKAKVVPALVCDLHRFSTNHRPGSTVLEPLTCTFQDSTSMASTQSSRSLNMIRCCRYGVPLIVLMLAGSAVHLPPGLPDLDAMLPNSRASHPCTVRLPCWCSTIMLYGNRSLGAGFWNGHSSGSRLIMLDGPLAGMAFTTMRARFPGSSTSR